MANSRLYIQCAEFRGFARYCMDSSDYTSTSRSSGPLREARIRPLDITAPIAAARLTGRIRALVRPPALLIMHSPLSSRSCGLLAAGADPHYFPRAEDPTH